MAAKLGHNTGGGVSINVDVVSVHSSIQNAVVLTPTSNYLQHWNEVDLTNSWPLNTQ